MSTYHMPKETNSNKKKQTYNDAVKPLHMHLYYFTQFTQWNQNSYIYLKDTQVCHFGIFFW